MITAVYIPPDANASSAIRLLYANITNKQSSYPDAVHIIAGDFNHANLKTALPKFHQHVKCATRGDNRSGQGQGILQHQTGLQGQTTPGPV